MHKNIVGQGRGQVPEAVVEGTGFLNKPGADIQTSLHFTLFTSLTLAPADGCLVEA